MKNLKEMRNTMEYAKWNLVRNIAVKGMEKHSNDSNGTRWFINAALYKKSSEKCMSIK